MSRGELWMVELGAPRGSAPAYRRPAVIVSADSFNRASLRTVVVVAVSSNLGYARFPGNVLLPAGIAGLTRDSVANVSQVATVDKTDLESLLGVVPAYLMAQVEAGLRLALALQ